MKTDSEMVNVGDDIVTEILVRMPAKSVARFKSTSKKWNNVISTSPWFCAHYTSDDMLMLGLFYQRIWAYDPIRFHPTTQQGKLLEKDIKVDNSCHSQQLVAASNEFLLFYEYPKYTIINPITNEAFDLPKCKRVEHSWWNSFGFICKRKSNVFGHSAISYKVVILERLVEYNLMLMEFITDDVHDWEILKLTCSYIPLAMMFWHPAIISEESGVIYMPVVTKPVGLFVYDHRKENSSQLDLLVFPEDAGYRSRSKRADHFGQTNGFIVYGISYAAAEQLDVWMLDEHKKEWSLKYRLNSLELNVVGIAGFHPLDRNELFLLKKDEKLVSYNVKSRRMELVPFPAVKKKDFPLRGFFPYTCQATFFLFGKKNIVDYK